MSGRDGQVFFDQLRLARPLQPYMGRPTEGLAELLNSDGMSGSHGGLTRSEVDAMIIDGKLSDATDGLTPVNLTWAMGFGWSSFIAQSVMVDCCHDAGFQPCQFLTEAKALPAAGDSTISVATDDVIHFLRASPCEVEQLAEPPLAVLDSVWSRRNVLPHQSKSYDLHLSGTALGVELLDSVSLAPRGQRLCALIAAAIDLMRSPFATPLELASIGGMVQWHDLMNKFLLSCLHHFYEFAQRPEQWRLQPLTKDALSELVLNISLFPLWNVDLTRSWMPFLFASDASPVYGFGFCSARCDADVAREAAAHAENCRYHFRLTRVAGDPAEKPRDGECFRLPVSMADFRDNFSVKASRIDHSGGLEAAAVVLAFRRLARLWRWHGHRTVFFIGALAVLFSLAKGRSSAPSLRFHVVQAASIALACDWRLHFAYLPSESNPADWPSRGLRYQRVRQRHLKPNRPSRCARLASEHKHVWRHMRRSRVCRLDSFSIPTSEGSSSIALQCGDSLIREISD